MTIVKERQVTAPSHAAPSRLVGELLVAGMVVLLAQSVRPLLTLVYEVGEDSGYGPATGGVALAFALPLLVATVGTRLRARAELIGAAAASGAFLALVLVDPIPLWLGAAAAAVAIAGVILVVSGLHLGTGVPHWLAIGLLVGLVADTALRASFRTWDLAWQHGGPARVTALVIVACVLGLARAAGRTPTEWGTGRDSHRPRTLAVLGPYLMLQLVCLQNPAFVASQGRLAFPTAVAVVLAGDLLVLVLLAVAPPVGRSALVASSLAAVVLAAMLPAVEGLAVVPLVLVMQIVVSLALARALAAAPLALVTLARVATGAVAAAEAFLLLVLLWQLDIISPLPFPRAVLPALAVVLVALPALGPSAALPRRVAMPRALVVAVAASTFGVPAGLWLDEPARTQLAAGDQVRLVSYNVRGSVTTAGQLRPDLVAAEIASSDPDIVVLQEVGRGMPVHGTLDLLAFLEDRLEMAVLYEPAADGQLGNAILSRWPMTEMGGGRLPHAGTQARSYILARIEVGDQDLTVLATHLQRSAEQIEAVLRSVGGLTPAIVAGDLNVDPGDELLSAFGRYVDVVDASGDACRTTSAEPTAACDRPDWVFVTPDLEVSALRIGTSRASDHLPIHVTLTVR